MKQIEFRNLGNNKIKVMNIFSVKERLQLLFKGSIMIELDFGVDSNNGVIKSEYKPII